MLIPYKYDQSQFDVEVNGFEVVVSTTGQMFTAARSYSSPSIRRNFKIAYSALLDRLGFYGFVASPGHRLALEECLNVKSPKVIVMSPCDCHALANCTNIGADINVLLVPEHFVRQFYADSNVEIYVDSHLERDDKFAVTTPRLFEDDVEWWMTPPPEFKAILFGEVITTLGSYKTDKAMVNDVYPKARCVEVEGDVWQITSGGECDLFLGQPAASTHGAWYNARCCIQGVTP